MNDLIQDMTVQTIPQFTRTGQVTRIIQYTYFVGTHGPFIDQFAEGADTVDAVTAKQQERIKHLQDVGAIPAQPGY
jgi:hypothetical protein